MTSVKSTALSFVPLLHKAKIQKVYAKSVHLPYGEPLTTPEIQPTKSWLLLFKSV